MKTAQLKSRVAIINSLWFYSQRFTCNQLMASVYFYRKFKMAAARGIVFWSLIDRCISMTKVNRPLLRTDQLNRLNNESAAIETGNGREFRECTTSAAWRFYANESTPGA